MALVFGAAGIIIEAMAISPLKVGRKKGWDLMFMAMLVGVLGGLISAVLSVRLFDIVFQAIGLFIAGYFLFEVRNYFAAK